MQTTGHRKISIKLTRRYETDETAWLEEMARLIRNRRYGELDYKNLRAYLTDMAKRDQREVQRRLVTMLAYLLKWEHQPERRSRSWINTWLEQQRELRGMLDSKSLKNYADKALSEAYRDAILAASVATRLPRSTFPAESPYSVEQLLSTRFDEWVQSIEQNRKRQKKRKRQ